MQSLPAGKGPKPKKAGGRSHLGLWTLLGVAALVVAYAGVLELSRPHVDGERLRVDTFVKLLKEDRIVEVRILDVDSYFVGTYRVSPSTSGAVDPGAPVPPSPELRRYSVPLVSSAQSYLLDLAINSRSASVTVDQQVGKRVVATASLLFPGLVLILLFVYLILSYRRGSGLFSIRSGARKFTPEAGGVTFADVAGQDAAVTELREVTQFLADPERYRALGAQVPKGVLLFGPPGCGKTLMARALAGEAGASFFSISGSDFVELYVGVGASRVRELFREARENTPAVIFIDELDSVGRRRGERGAAGGNDEREQALNQVLAEIDGFSPIDGIIVVAATNRPDVLDPALLRPGRFDRSVGLERPDEAARRAILELHARGKRWAPGADLGVVANQAIGMTGADLAGVLNDAALLAARDGHETVSQADLQRALQRALEAPERQRRLSQRDRSVGRRHTAEGKVTFADVAGVDEVVEELADVVGFLAHPEAFERFGARAPRGVLLTGPPGCGKTLLARALAGEANAAFFSVGGSDFVEQFVGVGAARVRDLFAEAAAVAPAIIFIDEIDSIGSHRGMSASSGNRETDQALNQVLIEMDGFAGSSGVIVVGATNRPDLLDPALLRPGRFDRQVAMSAPDRKARQAILAIHARGKPLAADVDLDALAGLTRGMMGADLAGLCNEAAIVAARRGVKEITSEIVEEAFDRVSLGLVSRGTVLSDEERLSVAYHEAGHALVARALPGASPPHKITIVPRGGTLGHCRSVDGHDRVTYTRSALVDLIAVSLGGRLAELLVFGEASGGSASDLANARRIARQMVRDEAMGEGSELLAWPESSVGMSQAAAGAVEEAERGIIVEATDRARGVLVGSREVLDRVAAALLESETLTAADIERLAAAPLRPVREAAPANAEIQRKDLGGR